MTPIEYGHAISDELESFYAEPPEEIKDEVSELIVQWLDRNFWRCYNGNIAVAEAAAWLARDLQINLKSEVIN